MAAAAQRKARADAMMALAFYSRLCRLIRAKNRRLRSFTLAGLAKRTRPRPIGIDEGVLLAIFTLWLSMMQALGGRPPG